MANYPPGYPPPPPSGPPTGPPYGPPAGAPYGADPRFQRQVLRDQAKMQRDMIRAQRDMYRAQMRGLRRSSAVGPLVAVSIGVLFLLVQLGRISSASLLTWYSRWWPLLLIGIGVIRLGEWALDQATMRDAPAGAPRPRRALGGGVILVLGLLAASGVLLSGARSHGADFFGHGFSLNPDNIDEFLGDKHESDQTLTHPCPANAAVSIDNPRGDILVSGTSDDGQIHVALHKEIFSRSDSEADEKARQFAPKIDASSGTLMVSMPSVEGGRANLTITVPESALLNVHANRGDVRVNGMKAPMSVTANHGDVDLSGIAGAITGRINNADSSFSAHSVTGAVTLEGHGKDLTFSEITGPLTLNGEFFGTTHLEHVRGMIRFHTSRTDFQLARLDGEFEISSNADLSADQVEGPMTLNTRNHNISLERVTGDLSVTNRNGSVDLTMAPPLGNVVVENRNGSVNMTLPNDAGFTVQADTTNGDLENEFDLQRGGADNHPSLSGTVNKGGPLVRITTSQGDVSLKKGTIAPLPPPPPMPPKLTLTPVPMPGMDGVPPLSRDAARHAAEEMKAAQEQVKNANREAAEAQKDAQRKLAAAQKELERATQQNKDNDKEE